MSIAPTALATNYAVNANPYSASRTVSTTNPYDTHEVTAASGQNIAYSMTVTTTGGCAQLFFVKGHNIGPQSQYYVVYSQENCVASYSNSFPVDSSDGTQFTVLITTEQSQDVNYTVSIAITTPAIPSWVLGLLAVVGIVVVIAVVRTVLRRRRQPAIAPPMAAPSYMAPPPGQPPYPPPPYAGQDPSQYPPPPTGPSLGPDRAAALRAAFLEGRLDRRLFAQNLARTLGVTGDPRATGLVEAFTAQRIDLELFERNLRSLQTPAS